MEKSLRVAGKNGRRGRHGQEGNQGQDRSAQERAVSGFTQSGYGELGGVPPAKRNSARHAKSPRSITLSLVRSAAERQGKGSFWNRKDSNRELSPTSTEKSRFRSPRINAGKHSSGILSPGNKIKAIFQHLMCSENLFVSEILLRLIEILCFDRVVQMKSRIKRRPALDCYSSIYYLYVLFGFKYIYIYISYIYIS